MIVVVTGANGLVGSRLCAALAERGASVRAVVRTAGGAPVLPGVAEQVGDFTDAGFATSVLAGADAAVTTVHPMGSDGAVQRRIGVQGTRDFAGAAAAGVFVVYAVGPGSSLGLTPGGLGVVEAVLSSALIAAGLVGSTAIAAVLVYRIVSLWLVLAVGGLTLLALARSDAILVVNHPWEVFA